jgi:hypothetical protein
LHVATWLHCDNLYMLKKNVCLQRDAVLFWRGMKFAKPVEKWVIKNM